MPNPRNALAYGAVGVGIVFVFAGISNRSVLATLQDIISGKASKQGPKFTASVMNQVNTPGAPQTPGASTDLRLYAQQLLALHGWAAQWPQFDLLEEGEGGWDPQAENKSSHALGLAQALGHGKGGRTAGTLGNQYGGYGLTDVEARAANSGDGHAQLKWMVNYIRSIYGNPKNAYGKWLSRNPHWY